MGLLKLRRDFQNISRLRQIVTILAKQGFYDFVSKARLTKHTSLPSRLREPQETSPQHVRETLEALGPTFIKLGQVLSLRPDLIPYEYCDEFRKLQDDVAPLPFGVVKGLVESELKQPLSKTFKTFKDHPVAAASIAQVHEAILKDGTRVAVKVLRPGIREVMRHDIDLMTYLATKIDKHYPWINAQTIIEEFKGYTKREVDLSFELRNIQRFHEFFKNSKDVVIPAAYEELSTKNVLVMDFIKGIRISDKASLKRHKFDMHHLASLGVQSMFRQIFELGVFHADPHPGNLLAVKKPKRQCLAFLDFGIVGFIDDELQESLLFLLHGLVERNVRTVTRALLRIGDKGAKCDPHQLERALSTIIMDWHGTTLRQQRASELIRKVIITGVAHDIEMPSDVVLMAKAFVTVEGTGTWLDENLNLTEEAKPFLQRALRRRHSPQAMAHDLAAGAEDLRGVLKELPYVASTLMSKIEEGKLELTFDKEEFKRMERDRELETNRTTLATTAAAFFIGSSFIAALAQELTVLGFPLWQLGMGGFLITLTMLGIVTMQSHKYARSG
ncbi:hypothetical protein GOV07_03840 [Candidatus Woesearchaeota archaeon]|nr:hypothetical protein [Candidatus Woesearchaeota archaeon]